MLCCEQVKGHRRQTRAFAFSLCIAAPYQVVHWGLVRMWEDVRRRPQDQDGPVHQEDRAGRRGDPGGHSLSHPQTH